MKKFGFGILAGFGGTFAILLGLFAVLHLVAPDRMPAPAITPIIQIDEKLKFIRDNPQIDPRVLAVGSSITFRQLAGHEFRNVAGGDANFLNGGVVHLQVDDTQDMTDFYLDNFPNVETVLMLTGLPDFEDCSSAHEPMMDPASARGFSFDRYPSLFYYLRYFSPQRYIRGIMEHAERSRPFYGDLYIDEFGSGPVKVPENVDLGLRYGAIGIDPTCIDAMADFAEDMEKRNVQLFVVFAPINPDYRAAFPRALEAFAAAAQQVRERVAHTNTFILDLHQSPLFAAKDFYDAFHLEWRGAQVLSEVIVTDLEHLHTDNAMADYQPRDVGPPSAVKR